MYVIYKLILRVCCMYAACVCCIYATLRALLEVGGSVEAKTIQVGMAAQVLWPGVGRLKDAAETLAPPAEEGRPKAPPAEELSCAMCHKRCMRLGMRLGMRLDMCMACV